MSEAQSAVTLSSVRVKFTKTGSLQFISHLDLMRTMTRLVLRADVNVYYTEGFNPKPKLVFALPLSVGTESVCELVDFKVWGEADCGKIKEALTREAPPEIEILEVYVPSTKFRDIAYAEYRIDFCSKTLASDAPLAAADAMSQPLTVMKRSKRGESECDIREYIKKIEMICFDEIEDGHKRLSLSVTLSADPEMYLNPEYVVTALKDKIGYGDDIAPGEDFYDIMRLRIFGADGGIFR
ncbi:MAG: TIGR03936 family radical SAM-associated protein [Firmicutes bacterium]|nr:TIGR03936 family radical SAM-associated protein [Bacillota bacterium]